MAAKARGLAKLVIGIGRDQKKLARAQQLAAIDVYTTDLKAGAAEADMVFVCTPVLAIVPVIRAIASSLKENAVVTDVGSTKMEITKGAEAALPEGRFFVGGHPMAGSEAGGVESALPYLFLNATYVITPTPSTHVQALDSVVRFAEALGSQVILMSPEEHDRSAAIISHLPHVISASLLHQAAEEQAKSGKVFQLAAGSFRDMTRVSSSPPRLWADICMSSKKAITSNIKRFEELLAEVRRQIESGDDSAIEDFFQEARQLRETWIKSDVSDE
jgi:prephenate dehydrogenase